MGPTYRSVPATLQSTFILRNCRKNPARSAPPNCRRGVPAFILSVLLAGAGCTSSPDNEPSQPTGSTQPDVGAIFTDRARVLGLDFVHFNGMSGERFLSEIMGAGAALFDYDNDGDLDIYLVQGAMLGDGRKIEDAMSPYSGDRPPKDRLYRNDLSETGQIHFTDITQPSGIEALGYGMGVAAGDIDNDGFVDLYVTNLGPNQMWRNNGDGTFTEATDRVLADSLWSVSASFIDYDRDGWLDLFVCNYVNFTTSTHKPCHDPMGAVDYCGPQSYKPYPDRLLRNRGDGTYEDVTAFSQIGSAYGNALGVVVADFNQDSWPDIYVANDGLPNRMWMNQRNGRFKDEGLFSGTAFNQQGRSEGSMGVDAGDFDNDGDDDLFMTHLENETNTLYRNYGSGLFKDDTFETELGNPSRSFTGFGTAWLDFDNDSWLDLLIANGAVHMKDEQVRSGELLPLRETNQLLRNSGNGRYVEVSAEAGTVFRLSEVSRGLAVGDFDNDGDTDAIVTNNNGPVRLLVNNRGSESGWLGVRLVDSTTGGDLYGTRVKCTRKDGRVIWRRVRADGSYCSSNDPRVLFGLGDADGIRALEAFWPDGRHDRWDGARFSINRYYTLSPGT